jgi:hypothetical protein
MDISDNVPDHSMGQILGNMSEYKKQKEGRETGSQWVEM